MQHLIENLKDISDRIALAQEKNDYEEILKLDHHRKLIVQDIFSIGIKQLSEENMETIRTIAEANEKMIAEISIAGTKKAATAHKKIRALNGYNK